MAKPKTETDAGRERESKPDLESQIRYIAIPKRVLRRDPYRLLVTNTSDIGQNDESEDDCDED